MGEWDDKFDRAERRWQTWNMQEYPLHERVLHRIIEDKARRVPDKIVFQFRDRDLTFAELNDNINRVANGLRKAGIGSGDKVAIMLPNCPEYLFSWFGANKIGAAEVPINVGLKGTGLAYQILQSDSKALIVDKDYVVRVADVLDELDSLETVVTLDRNPSGGNDISWPGRSDIRFADLLAESSRAPNATVRYNDLASILFTSGTTGRSKGVMMSHHYWYDVWAESIRYSRYTDEDILYTGLPLFHGNAQGITVGPAILAEARAVIVERFSASKFWDDCRRWNCTEANYIGGMIPILLKGVENDKDADNPVRLMVGAAAPIDQWDHFQERFNTKLLEVYGMTECYSCLASPYEEPRPGSCGKPITGWDVRVVDDDDMECAPGETGEIIARSDKMWVGTSGYYKNPEATLDLLRNGWMHTGDLGKTDEDGYFYFVDRKKQALRRRGENISSFEVEAVISSHPAVFESCVVGVPADIGEEDVKAVVVFKEGQSATEEEIIRWCEPRLAYFAIPRYLAFRDALPKTPSERVEKYRIKEEGITADCWDREAAGIKIER